MALGTCAGADVLRGHIRLPLRGAWSADLDLDAATVPSGSVTIAFDGGLSLNGAIVPEFTGVSNDRAYARVVGGAGGLSRICSGSYTQAQLRDPLKAAADAGGEAISSTIASAVLGVSLPFWTLGGYTVGGAIEALAGEAAASLGKPINWRFLGDGTLWLGAETYPAKSMPDTDVIIEESPMLRRFTLGVETPSLLPGFDLAELGRVVGVEHWITYESLRSWAWV